MILAFPHPRVLCLPFVCGKLKSKNNFNQGNAETKENSQGRPNKNNVVNRYSQGLLVTSQGLQIMRFSWWLRW